MSQTQLPALEVHSTDKPTRWCVLAAGVSTVKGTLPQFCSTAVPDSCAAFTGGVVGLLWGSPSLLGAAELSITATTLAALTQKLGRSTQLLQLLCKYPDWYMSKCGPICLLTAKIIKTVMLSKLQLVSLPCRSILIVRLAHTIWTQYRGSSKSKKSSKQTPVAVRGCLTEVPLSYNSVWPTHCLLLLCS